MPDSWVAVIFVPGTDQTPNRGRLHVIGFPTREDLDRWLDVCGPAVSRADRAQHVALAFGDIVLVPAIFAPRDRCDR